MAKIMETQVNVNEVSRISAGSIVKGEINSPNDIRIDGSFEGKIISKGRVVVGDKAVITGDIICQNVDFWGKMTGGLYVSDTLSLKESCVIDGDLHVKRLVVELGAKFDGNCKMLAEGEFEKLAASVSGTPVNPVRPVVSGTPVQGMGQNPANRPVQTGRPFGGTPIAGNPQRPAGNGSSVNN